MSMFRVRYACGAVSTDVTDDPRPNSSSRRKDGSIRIAVADTDTDLKRPTMPDGSEARCMFSCPATQRASGRKRIQCFPADESQVFKRWRYVVTCYGAVEKFEVTQ